jgi:hypothetical protein
MMAKIRQETALSDRRVNGWFRYRDLFQVIPMPAGAPVLQSAIGHHPFLLEFSYTVPDVSETGYNPEIPSHVLLTMIDDEASAKPRNGILLLLSTLSRHLVFQCNSSILNQQWFVKLPINEKDVSSSYDSVWGQGGYQCLHLPTRIVKEFSHFEATPIGFQDSNEYFNSDLPHQYVVGKTHDEFEFPAKINEYLDIYYCASDQKKKAFLSACSLLRQGIQLFSLAPSLAFAACVSSLEALIMHDHLDEKEERCECCNQPKYHVRQRFLDFIRTYGSDSLEGRKQADWIYSRRSSILHKGQLFLGEIEPRTMDVAVDWTNDDQFQRNVIRFFRICIVNWLVQRMGN